MRRGALAIALCASGCTSPAGCGAQRAACEALDLEVAGCARVLADGTCLLDRARALDVHAGPGSVTLEVGGLSVTSTTTIHVVVPEGAARFEVVRGCARAERRLGVLPPEDRTVAWGAEVRSAGQLARAPEELHASLLAVQGEARGRALGLAARLDRARGKPDEALEHLHEAIRLHRRSGALSDEVFDTVLMAFILERHRRDLSAAREALEGVMPRAHLFPEGEVTVKENLGTIARKTGDLRTALRIFEDEAAQASRCAIADSARDAEQMRALVLLELGRFAEAIAAFDALLATLPAKAGANARAVLLVNAAWARLLAAEVGARAAGAAPLLDEALAIYRGLGAHAEAANVLVNLALADLADGNPGAVAGRLAEARKELPEPDLHLETWWRDLEARAHLAQGRAAEARAIYTAMRSSARRAADPAAEWRAAYGLAASSPPEQAAAALEEAESILERRVPSVPVGGGVDDFLARHRRSSERLVEVLLGLGRTRDAMDAARRARSRALRALFVGERITALDGPARARWEQAALAYRAGREALDAEVASSWKLPEAEVEARASGWRAQAEALGEALEQAIADLGGASRRASPRGPAPGEVIVAYHRLAAGHAGFAWRHGSVAPSAARIADAADPRALLAPFAAELAGARRITIMASPDLAGVDFHALPWPEAPSVLGDVAPVAYAVDLGAEPALAAGDGAMLVIADPTGDLKGAREEGARVAELAARSSLGAAQVLARGEATGTAVRAAIAKARFLHYAGHGAYGGADGWESALPLASGAKLSAGDVLALPRVPAACVLSACEGAGARSRGPSNGLDMAYAFIARGTVAVIASPRTVSDRVTRSLAIGLYDPAVSAAAIGTSSRTLDLPATLRAAQALLRREHPDQDWAAFRAIVR